MEKIDSKGQLSVIEKINPAEVYNPGNIDKVLEQIEKEVSLVTLSLETEKDRKEVASLAYKVARSKTFLDDIGKKLGEDHRTALNNINAERKKVVEHLDGLRDRVRGPLDQWEAKETQRKAEQEKIISFIKELGVLSDNWKFHTVEGLENSIKFITEHNHNWEEFAERARIEKETALSKLNSNLDTLKVYVAEQAELAALRAAEAKRLEDEQAAKIAHQVAEAARIAEERTAQAEAKKVQEAVEAEKRKALEAEQAAERKLQEAAREKAALEQRIKDAEIQAKKDQEAAVEKERQRVEKERLAEIAATEKREANKRHSAKINNEVLAALVSFGVEKELAKKVVTEMVLGNVPHTRISY